MICMLNVDQGLYVSLEVNTLVTKRPGETLRLAASSHTSGGKTRFDFVAATAEHHTSRSYGGMISTLAALGAQESLGIYIRHDYVQCIFQHITRGLHP